MAVVILASHPKLSAHSGSNFAQFAHLRAAAESRESASKYASISICENWCDTKSVSEHRDRRWQFWVKILGQGAILGQNLGSRRNFPGDCKRARACNRHSDKTAKL